MMNRRSNDINGYVKFPVNEFPNENEGGMFVRLVVIPEDADTPVCCAGYCHIVLDESFLHDGSSDALEVEEYIEIGPDCKFPKTYRYETRHFPAYHSPDNKNHDAGNDQYLSVPYLAVILMGSTGWSCGSWHCTYDDLTDEGKVLYDSVQRLYPNSKLYLQTWLDT